MIRRNSFERHLLTLAMLLAFASGIGAQTSPETPDIPAKVEPPTASMTTSGAK